MDTPAPSRLEDIQIIDPAWYVEHGYPHDAWTLLRKEAPVHYFDDFDGEPFWAITKYDDVVSISRQPDLWSSATRNVISVGRGDTEDQRAPFNMILNMDPPSHGAYRKLVSKRFTPRVLKLRAQDIEHIALEILDTLSEGGLEGECDFVEKISAPLPIAIVAWILGVPREDWHLLFDWTNQAIGAQDPEYQAGADAAETGRRAQMELFAYFGKLLEQKRRNPDDDLISAVATARLEDGNLLPDLDMLGYYFLIVIAGNETTRNATSSGMLALAENPDQWRWLKQHPEAIVPATEEIARFTTPVIHFSRTATRDTEIRGQRIREGETVCMFYPSANRDEDVFPDPFALRLDREPNRHLAFGIGEHFCLGSHVARIELQVIFRHLAARIREFEITGPPSRLYSSLVGGIKHLPMRYQLEG